MTSVYVCMCKETNKNRMEKVAWMLTKKKKKTVKYELKQKKNAGN